MEEKDQECEAFRAASTSLSQKESKMQIQNELDGVLIRTLKQEKSALEKQLQELREDRFARESANIKNNTKIAPTDTPNGFWLWTRKLKWFVFTFIFLLAAFILQS
eukprot:TRINITY_DN1145_c0_g1_i2.p3 TRINITY_DN1145_c0_g1~~TRINITY_DN1145_c0_g1_i2.p3  ORF type:complete len:106 (-),score=26.25 TRINITY_DN1145_c0_g1_i2:47-364(-)